MRVRATHAPLTGTNFLGSEMGLCHEIYGLWIKQNGITGGRNRVPLTAGGGHFPEECLLPDQRHAGDWCS